MQDEHKDRDKDRRLKYLEMPHHFGHKAAEIDFQVKVTNRTCEALALILAREKPKSGPDFERHEKLKEFVVKTVKQGEDVMEILRYMTDLVKEVAEDAKVLCEGAATRDVIKDQSDTIVTMSNESRQMMRFFKEREKQYQAKIAEYERNQRGQNQGNS